MQCHKHRAVFVKVLILLLLMVPVVGNSLEDNRTIGREVVKEVAAEDLSEQKIVIINDAGNIVSVMTNANTVKDVLSEEQIALGPNDRVKPALEEAYLDRIEITRIETKQITKEQSINFKVERKPEPELYHGEDRVLQKGRKGLEKLIYEIVLENGKETGRSLINKIIVREPVAEIIAAGSKQIASRGGSNLEFERVLTLSATGYTHTGNMTYTDIWPNQLNEPLTNLPVIVVENAGINELLPQRLCQIILEDELFLQGLFVGLEPAWAERIRIIPYNSVGRSNGIMIGIRPDWAEVSTQDKKIRLNEIIIGLINKSLSNEGKYQALLPSVIFEKSWKGDSHAAESEDT